MVLGALLATWGTNMSGRLSRNIGTIGGIAWGLGAVWVFTEHGVAQGLGWLFGCWIMANVMVRFIPDNRGKG